MQTRLPRARTHASNSGMDVIRPNGIIGSGPVRIDGVLKVTGKATYGADQHVAAPAFAFLCTSPIARGRITAIDCEPALEHPGVLAILTYENVGKALRPGKTMMEGGHLAQNGAPLRDDRIYFAGQIIGMVVAETLETAQAAAEALAFSFHEDKNPAATFDAKKAVTVKANALGEAELHAGDIEKGFAAAAVGLDAWYETPAQHHNPMELFQCTCAWTADVKDPNKCHLTVWESTQNVRGFQHGLAAMLRIQPAQVRVLSPYIGGAFGSRGELGHHTALTALAAQRLGRPVKLVATRRQGFTLRTFRAETRHHLRLGADAEGRLTALDHESWEICGRRDHFAVAGSDSTARLYACANVRTLVHNVEAERQAPGFMRAPPEVPYLFPLECGLDELSYQLKLDPVKMRRRNDTMVETVTHLPFTSRALLKCINQGADIFGWSGRPATPATMRDGNEFVGFGFASAMYPTQVGPAECRLTLRFTGDSPAVKAKPRATDLRATVEVGTHEIGTGIRTVIAQTAADLLGLSMEQIEVVIGDSALPAAPLSAGSNSTASVCSVVAKACEELRAKIAKAATADKHSPLHKLDANHIRLREGHALAQPPSSLTEGLATAVHRASKGKALVVNASNTPHGAPPLIGQAMIRRGKPIILGGSRLKDRMQFAFGAHFVEVRVDRSTGMVRVPRMVGVFAAGRIMNERTARAQLQGGQVWGVASALHEATELDRNLARHVNEDLAEYLLPVCADVGQVETIMLDEVDTQVNALGIKGVGELGVTGVNAAIANAVFHATGIRCRKLPIRVGDVNLP